MWRQNASQERTSRGRNQERDRSISDEDDVSDEVTYDLDCSSNLGSLYPHGFKPPISLQAQSLKEKRKNSGSLDVNKGRNCSESLKKLDGVPCDVGKGFLGIKEEVYQKLQSESKEEHCVNSSSESISDEENMVLTKLSVASAAGKGKGSCYDKYQCEDSPWSAVENEAKKLAFLHTKTPNLQFLSHLSESKRNSNSGRGRVKPRFSIRSHIQSEELHWPHAVNRHNNNFEQASEDPERKIELKHRKLENSLAELLGYRQEHNEESHVNLVPNDPSNVLPSMADLLEDLQEKDGLAIGALDMNSGAKERKGHTCGKKKTLHLGTRTLDDEDPLEYTGDGVSSEDEDYTKTESHATDRIKRQTVADLFQEAFSTGTAELPLLPKSKQAGTGYYGRLQQVLQTEKDRHLEFLKPSQGMQSPKGHGDVPTAYLNDIRSITVQILSRFLEAKLTVCHCLLGERTKDFEKCGDEGKILRTVLFSSKICANVELEVGNLVSIHPPWKEVLVNKDEKIILCCYFRQIMA